MASSRRATSSKEGPDAEANPKKVETSPSGSSLKLTRSLQVPGLDNYHSLQHHAGLKADLLKQAKSLSDQLKPYGLHLRANQLSKKDSDSTLQGQQRPDLPDSLTTLAVLPPS